MLPRINRLGRQKDFKNIFSFGRVAQAPDLVLRFNRNDLDSARFGLVIGLVVDKKATVRNRLRRQVGEIIRNNLKNITPGFDIVLVAKPALAKKSFKEIEKEVTALFQKTKLFIKS
jgi:ribonuclease P protein component